MDQWFKELDEPVAQQLQDRVVALWVADSNAGNPKRVFKVVTGIMGRDLIGFRFHVDVQLGKCLDTASCAEASSMITEELRKVPTVSCL